MTRILRYAATGGTAAVIDLAGFIVLSGAGLALGWAAALSFGVAAVVNFTLSARLVFGARPGLGRFGAFLAFAVIGLAINTTVTVLGATWAGLPGWAAKCCGIGVAFGFNYAANARIVFRSR